MTRLAQYITPIQVVKAAWIGVQNNPIRPKGKWHKWIKELFNF